ncbi:glycoside hydrolase [Leuconostoc citreum]|uniref:glycoside hydrolase n=1 Tax=Leuconostoc citreum TaxID=33964 RepID=UPI0021A918D5|nr:glycoside hydrolase [Leuconostoc citreum]MCT3071093.1 glycoside hydrolase [Leuconostoc citreum]
MINNFFKPENAFVGDVVPFEKDGYAYLYFLYEDRKVPKTGMPWHLIRTKDYVNYEYMGEALPSGGQYKDDFNCYTGSVVTDHKGLIHLFYTGNNPRTMDANGKSLQLVMHAISDDNMKTWQKQENMTFGAFDNYEPYDWRDPYVFYDEDNCIWRMLLAARKKTGPERRRGVTAQCISKDLIHWEEATPFWNPNKYIAMECPEVFKWGDWWYFIYSEFSDGFTTQYKMSKSVDGPWLTPKFNSIDGRAFYASKSVFLNNRRYFTGWISTKENQNDDGIWQWAGTMSTLEATQNEDGTLSFKLPDEVIQNIGDGDDKEIQLGTQIQQANGYKDIIFDQTTNSERNYLKLTFNIFENTRDWGMLLRATDDGNESYVIRVEMNRNRMVFDRWPRKRLGSEQWQESSGDVPFYIELERPIDIDNGQHVIEVLQEGTLAVIVLDGKTAMSVRMYNRMSGHVGAFVDDGTIDVLSIVQRGA